MPRPSPIVELPTVDGGVASVRFPLRNGNYLSKPWRYNDSVMMASNASSSFVKDEKFKKAYDAALSHSPAQHRTRLNWRVHTSLWAAQRGLQLQGDFVECGVDIGILSKAIYEYFDFAKTKRKFYLLDTYEGLVADQLSEAELRKHKKWNERYSEAGSPSGLSRYDIAKSRFEMYKNAILVKGAVPGTLPEIKSKKIAYLSIDMNAAVPEIAAGEYLWDRLVSGAFIVLDDYGFAGHEGQLEAWDAFAAKRGAFIYHVSTGQGLLIKP